MQKVYKLVLPILGLVLFISTFAPQAASQINQHLVDNWWPVDNARVDKVQPFKARLHGRDVNDYNMFWQVDNGQWNFMPNNYTDYPHKETDVDLSGWNWRGEGPYTVSFIATNLSGQIIASKSIKIYVPKSSADPHNNQTASMPPMPAPHQTQNSPSLKDFYVNPNSKAKMQAEAWRNSRPQDAAIMDKISAQPQGIWLGNWNRDVFADVSNIMNTSNGSIPIFVVYNIPGRDCGGFSQGGLSDANAYKTWISQIASAIGNREAWVILEPDATAQIDCLPPQAQKARLALLAEAINIIKTQSKARVYLDAGHPGWVRPEEMAKGLKAAGIAKADGFALNVSNFFSTDENIGYGEIVSRLLSGKHFVIDTSRNGLGATLNREWCNPPGRALGKTPTRKTNHELIDAFLWIKVPGESDGSCNGGPPAGTWWPEYALELAKRAGY